MRVIRPHSRLLTIWRILLVFISLLPAFAISLFLKGLLFWIGAILWFVFFLGAYLVYLPILYKNLIYILDHGNITLRRGVFYNNIYTIPLSNIQFTTLTISPFSRLFGLVSLKIISPGARVNLPGLTMKEARAFSRRIYGYKGALLHDTK